MPKLAPSVTAFLGIALMVITNIIHVANGFLPGQDLTYVNAALGLVTWVLVHVFHVQAVASAVNKAVAANAQKATPA